MNADTPNRREFLQTTGATLAATLGAQWSARGASSRRPNIVLLFSDDHRFDTIAALGNSEIDTPNLDRLVARGTSFNQTCVMGGLHGAICVPSRAMLHTGRNLFSLDGPGDVIPPGWTSLPQALRAAGYETCAIGKWHNDRAAFSRFYDQSGPVFFGGMHDPFNADLHPHDPSGSYPRSAVRNHAGTHASEIFANAACDWIRTRDRARPFFLYTAFTAPHDPRVAPAAFHARYDPAKLSLPPSFLPRHPFDNGEMNVRDEKLLPWPRTEADIRQHTADYYAIISHLDAQVGQVLDTLDAQGLTDNTLVVFVGDNGLAVGRHGLLGKQNLYEHSLRVPLLMAGPEIPRAERRETLAYIHDLCPTLLEYARVALPDTVESKSLLPALGNPAHQNYASTLHAYRDLQRAVRSGQHKLIEYNVAGARTTQLFDLVADPWEMNNLANSADSKALRDQLSADLAAWRQRVGDPAGWT